MKAVKSAPVRKPVFWIAVALIGLCLFFIALQWNSFNAPFERDEGSYAYGAWIMTKGLIPYASTLEQKPPMIFFPYLLAVLINPSAFWPIHLIAFLSFALTVILLGLAVRREFGWRAGLAAMWLVVPMVMFPHLSPYAANTEKFMILPLAGLLAVYVYNKNSTGRWPWFWAAVCGAAAVLYKQIALFPVAFVFLVWLGETWLKRRSAPEIIKNSLSALAGGAVTVFLVTVYFFARGGFPGFWEGNFEYNRYYFLSTGGVTLNFLIDHLKVFWRFWPPLFALPFWFLARRPAGILFYLGLLIVSLATIFNAPYGHYYIMLMPFWAAVCAVAIDSLAEYFSVSFRQPSRRGFFAAALCSIVLFSMLWPVREWPFLSPEMVTARIYGPLNPFVEAPLVAARVARMTGPDDYIYIAGSEPEICYYAKRLTPVWQAGVYSLMINHPKALAYQQAVIKSLKTHPPKVIAWVRSPLSWLGNSSSPRLLTNYLDELLREHYTLAGGSLRSGTTVGWQDAPLKAETYGFCSIKVYKLNE
ncbi:MAG: hypothetical protein JW873_05520 [Candidatus Saganbacteria bacterium]|nr:hypothetical protein [Candidatus Saganbacteria bacterium]